MLYYKIKLFTFKDRRIEIFKKLHLNILKIFYIKIIINFCHIGKGELDELNLVKVII